MAASGNRSKSGYGIGKAAASARYQRRISESGGNMAKCVAKPKRRRRVAK